MKLFNLNYKYYLLLLFPLLLIACDNDSDPVPPPTLTSIQISTDETSGLPVGYNRQYNAIGSYSDNSQENITATVHWRSSTASATISNIGVVTADNVGTSEISATYAGITSTSITLTVTNATADSLVIERKQSGVDLPIRRYEQLLAFIVFSDSTVIDVTKFVSWTSLHTEVITVDNTLFSPAKGEILAVVDAGTSDITATDPFAGVMATVTITTSNATLTEIIIDPVVSVTLPKGTVQEYTAQGLFSDDITRDLDKSRLAWESVNNTIATFIEDGLLQAKSVGETRVNVIDNDQGIIKTRATTVSVTDAVKVAVVTVPVEGLPGDSVQLPVGHYVQYQAYSVYTDGSFIDTTNRTTFTSSDNSIAEKTTTDGRFRGKAAGTVTIAAFDNATKLEAEPAELEVTSAVLETMIVYPNFPQISPGERIQLSVFGSFSDGSSMDLTKTASWSSDNQAVAAVSNSELTKGLVTGREPGSANITAAVDENTSIIAIVNVIR